MYIKEEEEEEEEQEQTSSIQPDTSVLEESPKFETESTDTTVLEEAPETEEKPSNETQQDPTPKGKSMLNMPTTEQVMQQVERQTCGRKMSATPYDSPKPTTAPNETK